MNNKVQKLAEDVKKELEDWCKMTAKQNKGILQYGDQYKNNLIEMFTKFNEEDNKVHEKLQKQKETRNDMARMFNELIKHKEFRSQKDYNWENTPFKDWFETKIEPRLPSQNYFDKIDYSKAYRKNFALHFSNETGSGRSTYIQGIIKWSDKFGKDIYNIWKDEIEHQTESKAEETL